LEIKLLRKAAIQSLALMIGVVILSYIMEHYNAVAISASKDSDESFDSDLLTQGEINNISQGFEPNYSGIQDHFDASISSYYIFPETDLPISQSLLEKLGEQFLIIKKPSGKGLQIKLEDIYLNKSLKLVISGVMDEEPEDIFIGRVNGNEIFNGEPVCTYIETFDQKEEGIDTEIGARDYGNDPVNLITSTITTDDFGISVYDVVLELNHVYVHILYEDDNFYYIDLRRPNEVYDKIIVLDAGHGGKDPGALSKDELTYEKEINLAILTKLKELLDKDNIKVYYTKLTDETLFLRPRVTLANEVDCDFFISIHCNSSVSKKANGTEIFYYDHENKNIKSKDLAEIFIDEISKSIPLKNNGIRKMKDKDIFILYNATVPAVLIEAGYMSDRNDLEYLKSKEGQDAIAKGIYNGIWRAYEELMPSE
jgi:N-acetylmuramoyl-L-alanine amidase